MSGNDKKPDPKPETKSQGGFVRDPNRIRPTNMRVAAFDSADHIPQHILDAMRKANGGEKK